MSTTTEHPKVFISYSWTSPEHEQFVLSLATALRENGVDCILDKWDLRPGQDKYAFMESMVVDPAVSRVLIICDRKYQEKANARAGGVGTETQIISQELYGRVEQTKFIPVICERDDDGSEFVPVFIKSRVYIDISSDDRYGEGLDELLRLIYDRPLYQKPTLGAAPAFVSSNKGSSHVRELGSALRAIREGKSNRQGLEAQFIKGLIGEIQKLYVEPTGNEYDEGVYQAIVATKGLRDQFADYVDTVAAFSSDEHSDVATFIDFMEKLGSCFGIQAGRSGTYYPGWVNFYEFLACEAMLMQIAASLRYRRWHSINRVLSAAYLVSNVDGEIKTQTFTIFSTYLRALDEHRNNRLKLQRVSLSADMLKERCGSQITTFNELMQADTLLCLKSTLAKPSDGISSRSIWRPRTSAYAQYGNKHPIFMKAVEGETKAGIRIALGFTSNAELSTQLREALPRIEMLTQHAGNHFSEFNLVEAINFNELVK